MKKNLPIIAPPLEARIARRPLAAPRSRQEGFLAVPGGKAGYTPDATYFDGSTYLQKTSFTGVSDHAKGTIVFYGQLPVAASAGHTVLSMYSGVTLGFMLQWAYSSFKAFQLLVRNSASTVIMNIASSGILYHSDHSYVHYLATWDLSVPEVGIWYEGLKTSPSSSGGPSVGTCDYTGNYWRVGAREDASEKYLGNMGYLWFAPGVSFSIAADATTPELFYDRRTGMPKDLGPDGSKTTGIVPALYLRRDRGQAASAFFTNRGSGGAMDSTTGALGDSTPKPARVSSGWKIPTEASGAWPAITITAVFGRAVAVDDTTGSNPVILIPSTGAGSNTVRSTDGGETWTLINPGSNNIDMIFIPDLGLFVSGGGGNVLRTSPDGLTWTSRTIGMTPDGLAWASTSTQIAVAVGSTIYTSPDAITWTSRTNPLSGNLNAVAFSPTLDLFAATSFNATNNSNLDRICTSPDGITWTARTCPIVAIWEEIAWSEPLGLFVAVGRSPSSGQAIITSPDGITWTQRSLPAGFNDTDDCDWRAVWWSELLQEFIISGQSIATAGRYTMARSKDGINWRMEAAPAWVSLGRGGESTIARRIFVPVASGHFRFGLANHLSHIYLDVPDLGS